MQKANNRWARADFATKAPGPRLGRVLRAPRASAKQTDVHRLAAGAVTGIAALVASRAARRRGRTTSRSTRSSTTRAILPKAFVDERFAFYGKTLTGHAAAARPLEARASTRPTTRSARRSASSTSRSYFPPRTKARAAGDGRRTSSPRSRGASTTLDWMAPETKAKAKAKLARAQGRRRLSRQVARLLGARGRARRRARQRCSAPELFEYRSATSRKLGKPVDRGEWVMTPQTVNAVNLPVHERDELPGRDPAAAVLRPDARRRRWTTARSARSIGHEISHSFDDQGAQFDATGRLRNWWTDGRLRRTSRPPAQQLATQYDAYKPFPDLARQRQADAGREHRRRRRPRRRLRRLSRRRSAASRRRWSTGLTGDQQFFLAFAQSRRAEAATGGDAAAPDHRRPRAAALSRADRAQPRRLVRRVSGEADG